MVCAQCLQISQVAESQESNCRRTGTTTTGVNQLQTRVRLLGIPSGDVDCGARLQWQDLLGSVPTGTDPTSVHRPVNRKPASRSRM